MCEVLEIDWLSFTVHLRTGKTGIVHRRFVLTYSFCPEAFSSLEVLFLNVCIRRTLYQFLRNLTCNVHILGLEISGT
jgi:hypothetical protein